MDSTEEKHTQKLNGSNGSTESSPYAVFGEGAETTNEAIMLTTVHDKIRKEEKGHSNPGFADSGSFKNIPADNLNSTGEENEATRRITGYSKNWDDIMERRCFTEISTDSGPFQTMPGDSLDSVQAEIETTSQNTLPTNHRNEEGGNMYSGVQNIQEDSWDSIFTTTDITSSGFMLRSGIHVPTNRYDFPNFTDRRDLQAFQQQTNQEKTPFCKKKYLSMLRFLVLMVVLGGIAGGLTKIIHDKYFAGSNDTPTIIIDDLPNFPDKCENDVSTVTVGEQMCIPYTQKFTGSPSGISVKQLSSQYLSALQGFSVNVSSDTFMQRNGDWIVNFNSSRPDQQLRFMVGKATCDSIGKYEISIEYDDGNVTTNKFEVSLKDPQLQHSVTRINDNIHIHCEMIKTCMASSLVLFVNDGGSSRMIPNINVCSNNDQQSGTTVSVDAIIGASWFSGNTTISCVPLITDSGLAANLTSTTRIPVCEGDCVPDCKDDPQGKAYFPDKHDCTQFYQCSNGQLVSQSCSPSTYWSTSECTCVHFDDEICNRDTNKFLSPLLSIEKCTNASLV